MGVTYQLSRVGCTTWNGVTYYVREAVGAKRKGERMVVGLVTQGAERVRDVDGLCEHAPHDRKVSARRRVERLKL